VEVDNVRVKVGRGEPPPPASTGAAGIGRSGGAGRPSLGEGGGSLGTVGGGPRGDEMFDTLALRVGGGVDGSFGSDGNDGREGSLVGGVAGLGESGSSNSNISLLEMGGGSV